ncbi:MAG: hypothetical protein GY832_24140 [Chloroflexi bacterium]|nr:hypothetical protein [Chloroflexota bacterium]
MPQSSEERRRFFHQAVTGFAQRHPGYTVARIECEIAQIVGLSPSSVQKWRAGHSISKRHIPILAEWAVQKAGMDRRWLRSFLRQCDPTDNILETRLFGSATTLSISSNDVNVPDFENMYRRSPR